VLFIEPAFPANQREFARALASIGAHVLGIGERPYDWIDDEAKGWLGGYQQIASVTDESALEWAVRNAQSRMWIDRLEATVEAHILPAAHVRERCTIPGISARTAYLCRDKVAMKEVLRHAGVPTSTSAGVSSTPEARDFTDAVGFPVIIKPRAAAGALGTFCAGNPEELEAAARASGLADGATVAIEEFIEVHEGFYDTLTIEGRIAHDFISHYFPNVLEAMRARWISPQIIATNRMDALAYAEVKEMGRQVVKSLGIGTAATHME
jgi:formate-dependent phosphoribosylglycinamide formyltransferase (GAR transformylase)